MVSNVHERVIVATPAQMAALIDDLAGPDDRLWPRGAGPAMYFNRPLGVGAIGGHGPIRYTVGAFEPGRSIRFRFHEPRGFHGNHQFAVTVWSCRSVEGDHLALAVHRWSVGHHRNEPSRQVRPIVLRRVPDTAFIRHHEQVL